MPFSTLRHLTTLALAAGLAACSVASAETAGTAVSFTVTPGPLVLRAPSSIPLHFHQVGLKDVAYLPTFAVEDATGSGHGWHLRASVHKSTPSVEYALLGECTMHLSQPRDAEVEGSNAPRLGYSAIMGTKASTVAFATPNTGMGTFAYERASISIPSLGIVPSGLVLKLALSSKP